MHFGDYGEDDASHGAQSKSWLAHTQGQLAILNARQPREFRSGKAHLLFADYRYILVRQPAMNGGLTLELIGPPGYLCNWQPKAASP